MVVVFALVIDAKAEGLALQALLQQALVGVNEAEDSEANPSTTDPMAENKNTGKLVGDANNAHGSPGTKEPAAAHLKDVGLKELVAVDTTALIDVTEIPQSDAVDAINAAGLKVGEIRYGYSNNVPRGTVIKQEPEAGTPLAPKSEVKLVVAAGLSDLAKRVYDIEAEMLTKWDVAMVVSTMIAGIVFIVGITVYVFRYCAKTP